MKSNKRNILIGAVIWLTYIVWLWFKDGVKSSISSLFSSIPIKSYVGKRLIVGIVYVSAALFMGAAVMQTELPLWTNLIGLIATIGFAMAGIFPDSRYKDGIYNRTKDILHGIGALTAIYTSMIYIIAGAIAIKAWGLLLIPAITVLGTNYMIKERVKNRTTWIELLVFFSIIAFILLI